MMKKTGLTIVLATMVSLSACHTVDGAGKDLKSAGTAVSEASGKEKK